jgi:hypothetical protein
MFVAEDETQLLNDSSSVCNVNIHKNVLPIKSHEDIIPSFFHMLRFDAHLAENSSQIKRKKGSHLGWKIY